MALMTGIRYNVATGVSEEYTYEAPLINPRKGEIERRLQDIRVELQQTDYKAIKFGEGIYTEEQYAPTKALREGLRAEYNELEIELANAPEYLAE